MDGGHAFTAELTFIIPSAAGLRSCCPGLRSPASAAQRAGHDVVLFLGLELRIFALKELQDILGHFVAHIHLEHVPVMARTIPEVHDKTGYSRFGSGVAQDFSLFADGNG